MSIEAIVTMGYGTFADVYDIPVMGYSPAVVVPTIPGLEYRITDNSLHYKVIDNGDSTDAD